MSRLRLLHQRRIDLQARIADSRQGIRDGARAVRAETGRMVLAMSIAKAVGGGLRRRGLVFLAVSGLAFAASKVLASRRYPA